MAYVNDAGFLVIVDVVGIIGKVSIDMSGLGAEPVVGLSWGPTLWHIETQM